MGDDTAAHARRQELERRYESLCRQYGDSLFRLASSYESVPDAREDVLQEIRMALWKALPAFRGECSLRTFVYRVAHNRGLTHVWRRRTQAQASEDFPEVGDPRPSPESSAIRNSDYASLMKAIRRLPIAYRQVITMALDELPQSEIAAVLGISENNVAVRLNRARKLLRQELGGK
jgi:RNA polymerase sigma-70 factor (ECF subfamily)